MKKLDQENYAVINGPALKYGGQVKEFDHIVVGKTGVFCIETKAFGDRWEKHKVSDPH